MSTESSSTDPLVRALQKKINHQAERIDNLEEQIEDLRARVEANALQLAESEDKE